MTSAPPQQLIDLLGADAVLPPERLPEYAIDGLTPQVVVRPDNRRAIAEVLGWATATGHTVAPRGGGTKLGLGNSPRQIDVVLDLSRYRRVIDYQPADLTATVETGISLAALRQELAQSGQLVALESPLAERATIGGILATAASGPLRLAYGLAREWLIGVSVIAPDGMETKAGGRVVKNVTGYDLNKLYTGSLGTLGVLVEATFKLSARPTAAPGLLAAFPSLQEGIAASRAALSQATAPQAILVVNPPVIARLSLPESPELNQVPALVIAFFQGRPRGVQRRVDESTRLLLARGAGQVQPLDTGSSELTRQNLTDLGWSPETAPTLGIKVSLSPTAVGQLVTALLALHPPGGGSGTPGVVADAGFGSVHLYWWPDALSLDDAASILQTIAQVREMAYHLGGTAVVEHCPPTVKQRIDVWGETSGSLEIMRRLKKNFDPQGVLNPGRFMGGL